jgi:quercetin dioxygenase-like cupin family protein
MTPVQKWPVAVIVGAVCFVAGLETGRDVASAQARKAIYITRMFTGPDNQTHTEDVEATFGLAGGRDVAALMKITGAELHRTKAGTVNDWHPAPQRQYVITLSGRGEIEVAGGKKISLEPGHIELAEDLTGKGHITRAVGAEDRITLWLPLADQPAKK